MKMVKQFALSTEPTSGNTTTTKTVSKKRYVPQKEADLLSLATQVSTQWQATPAITLVWMTATNFASIVNSYNTNLNARIAVGSERVAKTRTLQNINVSIDKAVSEVKIYIAKKFKKDNAIAQYARYGLVNERNSYTLPRDNDKRKLALPLMLAAITADGFGNEDCGTTFWTNIINAFNTAHNSSAITSKNISSKVGAKNTDMAQIRKVLSSLLKVLEANYPDTFETTLRTWGFIKESY